ncbi:MAG: enoyl-CoA hydratase-related protein [Burkholderiales bacterium]
MPDYTTITVGDEAAVRIITLNRPDQANGINHAMARELAHAAAACEAAPGLKAVVFTGAGRFFSAGGDVRAMAAFGERLPAEIKLLADDLHRAVSTFSRMRVPLVAAVNGIAAGAGMSLAVAADLVVACEEASFTMAYSGVGLSPDGSSSYFLPRLVGLRRAQELMYTNRRLTAAEALDWGLVNRVVPQAALMDEVRAMVGQLTQGSPESNAGIKQLLLASFGNGLETQMELEGRQISACAGTVNGQEGVTAFVQKRRPDFR